MRLLLHQPLLAACGLRCLWPLHVPVVLQHPTVLLPLRVLPARVRRFLVVLGVLVLLSEGLVDIELGGAEVLVVGLPRYALKVLVLFIGIDV